MARENTARKNTARTGASRAGSARAGAVRASERTRSGETRTGGAARGAVPVRNTRALKSGAMTGSTPEQQQGWLGQIRRVLMAGAGALVLAQEEIEEFVEKLVQKGEVAEKDGRKLLLDTVTTRTQEVTRELENLQMEVSSGVKQALSRMNLVSRGDIADLNRRIDDIAKKLDRLETGK